jgi:hypothetical protein
VEARLAVIEEKLSSISTTRSESDGNVSPGTPEATPIADVISKTLMEMEKQREEARVRAHNVIVSGFSPQPGKPDAVSFEEFCEDNLTVKPKVIRTRRFGRSTDGNQPTKLCITLDSADSVNSLLESAFILRQNRGFSNVYINRDLTKTQAEAAYKARTLKRATQSGSQPPASASQPPFSVSS